MIAKHHRFAFAPPSIVLCLLTAWSVAIAALPLPSAMGAMGGDEKGLARLGFDENAQNGYRDYLEAPQNRAFAIAPGGAWAWVSGADLQELAEIQALDACRKNTEQPCHLYSVNSDIVFNSGAWAASWDLHARGDFSTVPMGTRRGQRFPDLAVTTPEGRATRLSELRGRPAIVHFWGSWCPPCQAEFPELQKLYDALAPEGGVSFILLQGHEPIAKSRRWIKRRGFTMPLYDSGQRGQADDAFTLADGTSLNERRLAGVYPTTYVLNADGLVVFRHDGPVKHWEGYEAMIRHLAHEKPNVSSAND